MRKVLKALYPSQCVTCRALVEGEGALCPDCWSETPFLTEPQCPKCAIPLIGTTIETGIQCDDCIARPRPWVKGVAAFEYAGNGRRMILGLKHGGRLDLVRPLAGWIGRAVRPHVSPETCLVPVPLHWSRLLRRRFNQSAALATSLGDLLGVPCVPDALWRTRKTAPLDGVGVTERTRILSGAIALNPRRLAELAGRDVVLIDDVMTSGATLAAAALALEACQPRSILVAVAARVVKD